jgi:hypothetical protein
MVGMELKEYVQSELLMMSGDSTRNMYSVIEINKLKEVIYFFEVSVPVHHIIMRVKGPT